MQKVSDDCDCMGDFRKSKDDCDCMGDFRKAVFSLSIFKFNRFQQDFQPNFNIFCVTWNHEWFVQALLQKKDDCDCIGDFRKAGDDCDCMGD